MLKKPRNCNHKKNILIFILSLIFLISFDQIIKFLIERNVILFESFVFIPNVLKITYLRNYGAAFGILFNMRLFLIFITTLFLIFFIWLILKIKVYRFYDLFASSMLISGGFGNLIDRVFKGYVVDYCNLIFWPFKNFAIFNLADCLTFVGCSMLFLKIIFSNIDFDIFLNKLLKKENKNFNEKN